MRVISLGLAAILTLASAVVVAQEPAGQTPMDRQQILDLVREKTTECRKEKDQSLCANWFAKYGEITRIMHADGARKEGAWFVDDQDRLCILWKGKIKPLCFKVFEQDDETYALYKGSKHITTIIGTEEGNTKGL